MTVARSRTGLVAMALGALLVLGLVVVPNVLRAPGTPLQVGIGRFCKELGGGAGTETPIIDKAVPSGGSPATIPVPTSFDTIPRRGTASTLRASGGGGGGGGGGGAGNGTGTGNGRASGDNDSLGSQGTGGSDAGTGTDGTAGPGRGTSPITTGSTLRPTPTVSILPTSTPPSTLVALPVPKTASDRSGLSWLVLVLLALGLAAVIALARAARTTSDDPDASPGESRTERKARQRAATAAGGLAPRAPPPTADDLRRRFREGLRRLEADRLTRRSEVQPSAHIAADVSEHAVPDGFVGASSVFDEVIYGERPVVVDDLVAVDQGFDAVLSPSSRR